MSKHRAPRYVRTKKALARVPVATGATVVGLGVLTSPAQASTTHDWTGVAACESGGDWSINTGNGYFGGLQFSQSTWAAFGGTAFAPRADLATPAQQVETAEKVLAGQGVGAWPTCGKRLTDGTTPAALASTPAPAPEQPAAEQPAPAQPAAETAETAETYGRHAAGGGDYTVRRGDTVAKIAAAHGERWRELYQRNLDVIGSNPNRILPGQVLEVAGDEQVAPAPAPASAPAPAPESGTVGNSAPAPQAATAPAPEAAPAPVAAAAPVAAPATAVAKITNSAGAVKPQAQAAADAVVSNVPGAAGITIGGTRASAVDPHGHPSGLALDYMVADAGLGDAIAQYQIEHWDELGVEYVIWQQRILTSPTGSWKAMEDRGSATANHFDHVHVNYRAA
ncbi:transglycosylase family protein [Geodermatophilus sp. CPCC 206100]|uniref:transglycosylase family protein n=1 Tax=Geodermatophilus sp. CPCC 206100 TaxID=3020054 RepID=UPI003AFFB15B